MPTFPDTVEGQFSLTVEAQPSISNAEGTPAPESRSFNAIQLRTHGQVGIVTARTPNGDLLGFFIGEPIDPERRELLHGEIVIDWAPGAEDDLDRLVEENVYRLAGKFLFVLSYRGTNRIYLDAGGTMPLVFDPERRIAGATAAVIYSRSEFLERFDAELFSTLQLLNGGWFPAGLTAHAGLQRLMCNFYLDLDSWTVHRHWPCGNLPVSADPLALCDEIADEMRSSILAYGNAGKLVLALTGGHETRLLLSLCRDFADEMDFVCFYHSESDRDLLLAKRLTETLGLRLKTLRFGKASEESAEIWMARSGYCSAENRYIHEALRQLDEYDFFGGGSAGEVGRGFFWRAGDAERTLTGRDIVARLGMPSSLAVNEAVERWHETVKDFDPLLQLDLAYVELRVSCWGSPQAYSTPDTNHVNPIVSRAAFTKMLMLPPEWRMDEKWIKEVIRRSWPEALAVPINSLGPLRDKLILMGRAIRQPGLVARKIRRRFL